MRKYKAPYRVGHTHQAILSWVVYDSSDEPISASTEQWEAEQICHALNQASKLDKVREVLKEIVDLAKNHLAVPGKESKNELDLIVETLQSSLKLLQEEGE